MYSWSVAVDTVVFPKEGHVTHYAGPKQRVASRVTLPNSGETPKQVETASLGL
jgi:hypothetical protein